MLLVTTERSTPAHPSERTVYVLYFTYTAEDLLVQVQSILNATDPIFPIRPIRGDRSDTPPIPGTVCAVRTISNVCRRNTVRCLCWPLFQFPVRSTKSTQKLQSRIHKLFNRTQSVCVSNRCSVSLSRQIADRECTVSFAMMIFLLPLLLLLFLSTAGYSAAFLNTDHSSGGDRCRHVTTTATTTT